MKKLILLFVACISLTSITSCSKDDDGSSASLQGKWEYSKEGIGANGQEVLTDYEHTTGCNKDFIQITATTVTDHSFFNDGDGCQEETFSTSYTRNGNTLTTGSGADASVGEILTLDGSTLKVKYSDSDFPGVNFITVYKRVN